MANQERNNLQNIRIWLNSLKDKLKSSGRKSIVFFKLLLSKWLHKQRSSCVKMGTRVDTIGASVPCDFFSLAAASGSRAFLPAGRAESYENRQICLKFEDLDVNFEKESPPPFVGKNCLQNPLGIAPFPSSTLGEELQLFDRLLEPPFCRYCDPSGAIMLQNLASSRQKCWLLCLFFIFLLVACYALWLFCWKISILFYLRSF